MTSVYGSVDQIKEQPELDGSHIIVVHDFGGESFEVLIQPDEVAVLLQVLQEGAMNRAEQRTPRFPQLTMTDVTVGYQDKQAGLLVTTAESGTVALRGPIEIFQKLGAKVDQAIEFLSGARH